MFSTEYQKLIYNVNWFFYFWIFSGYRRKLYFQRYYDVFQNIVSVTWLEISTVLVNGTFWIWADMGKELFILGNLQFSYFAEYKIYVIRSISACSVKYLIFTDWSLLLFRLKNAKARTGGHWIKLGILKLFMSKNKHHISSISIFLSFATSSGLNFLIWGYEKSAKKEVLNNL